MRLLRKILAAGILKNEEYTLLRRDGSRSPAEISTTLLRDSGGRASGFIGIIRDISRQKAAEAAEREQRALAEALADTATTLNRTLDLGEVLERILDNVGEVVPHDGANVMLLEDGVARIVSYHGYESDEYLPDLRFLVKRVVNLQQMATTSRALLIADTQDFDGWVDLPQTRWIRSYLGAPIRQEGEVAGFLNLDAATPDFFTPADASRLQAFADQAAIAIRNAQLYEAEQQRRRVAETLRRAATVTRCSLLSWSNWARRSPLIARAYFNCKMTSW
jgi:transcriptional regulator with GAF, ATPase, and Fis domain